MPGPWITNPPELCVTTWTPTPDKVTGHLSIAGVLGRVTIQQERINVKGTLNATSSPMPFWLGKRGYGHGNVVASAKPYIEGRRDNTDFSPIQQTSRTSQKLLHVMKMSGHK